MQAEKEEAMKEAKMSIWRLLRSSVYRQQLFVALMMHFSQQFSGINAVRSIYLLPFYWKNHFDWSFMDHITIRQQ